VLDLIYIVEEQYAPSPREDNGTSYTPNFTIPGQSALAEKPAYTGAALTAASVATSLLVPFLPSLLIGAAAAAAGLSGISGASDSSAIKTRNVTPEGTSSEVSDVTAEARLVESDVQNHSLTRRQAKYGDY